ncbi:MAG: hypothetical protein K5769_10945 [Pseudobutyrivibrio sp.]|nr:hypothetical protein [Pseudobutyrivibrio sp.]
MDVNTLSNVSSNVATTYTKATDSDNSAKKAPEVQEKQATENSSKFSEAAAVYEKSTDDAVVKSEEYAKADRSALIQQLKDDQEKMKNNLMEIVMKSISGQGNAFAIASEDDMWKFLASGEFKADADTIAKAKEDISEDGYWGVDQTSDRIVDFAIALSGGDSSKADELLDAFKKGYEQATGVWGKDLPDITKDTYKAVEEKFQAWKEGTYKSGASSSNTTVSAEQAIVTEG